MSPSLVAPMIEGSLFLSNNSIYLRTNQKYIGQGWAPEIVVPLSEVVHVNYKPGGFASGGFIIFQCARDNYQLKVNFSLGQSQAAGTFVARLEKDRAELSNPILFTAKGVNGQIELLADRIRIKRAGTLAVLGHGLKGDKEIQLSSISSIQFRSPGALTNGYIQFAFIGGTEAKNALLGATQDENSVVFSAAQAAVFLQLKNGIEAQKAKLLMPNVTVQQQTAPSEADELEKLASLRDRGILTDEEFTAKKRQILGL